MVISTAKILVVSQDDAIRNLVCRFLTRQNYQVEKAKDSEAAIALFDEFTPNLIILDVGVLDADRSISRNGLLINGHKLSAHNLQHEDEIIFSPLVRAVYYQLSQDARKPPDEFDRDDDDSSGGIAPTPRPWKPTPPLLTDEDAISPDENDESTTSCADRFTPYS